jgi:hypothetical protein
VTTTLAREGHYLRWVMPGVVPVNASADGPWQVRGMEWPPYGASVLREGPGFREIRDRLGEVSVLVLVAPDLGVVLSNPGSDALATRPAP